MKKKIIWVISLIIIVMVVVPIGFLYVLSYGNPYTKYIANKEVPKYLEEKGYTENDIEEAIYTEPKHIINKDIYHGHYMVVFKDEPDIMYYYGVTKKGKKVVQFCEKETNTHGLVHDVEGETKNSENNCIKSLENRKL